MLSFLRHARNRQHSNQRDHITTITARHPISTDLRVGATGQILLPRYFRASQNSCREVDIFSPNHAELASFFETSPKGEVAFDKSKVAAQAEAFVPLVTSRPFCIIVRCAEHGCFVIAVSEHGTQRAWAPAYHLPGSDQVVDTTGAGNAFLGGAAIGYLKHGDLLTATGYGTVAASFVVETVGLPEVGECDATARLDEYVDRLCQSKD